MTLPHSFRIQLLSGLLFLSGFAGLGYEIVWTRTLSTILGHEMISVMSVISAFFCGLALGAWALDRPISRSSHPGRWYAALEIMIGIWALVVSWSTPRIMPLAFNLLTSTPSPIHHWAVAFFLPLLLLLPATTAMGGTLPAMERLFSRACHRHRSIGRLYAVNTLGAVAGTIATTFWIAPLLGFAATQHLLALFNLICAVGVLVVPCTATMADEQILVAKERPAPVRLYTTLCVTGLLGIGYEIVIIRVLSQTMENTVYSFAIILSVYLLGTSIGAAVFQKLKLKSDFHHTLNQLLLLLSLVCLANMFWLHKSGELHQMLMGDGVSGIFHALAIEGIIALAALLLPTLLMGATFTHLAQAARHESGGFGYALGINTMGACLSAAVFGAVFLPLIGIKWTMIILCLSYITLCPVKDRRQIRPWLAPVGLAAIITAGPFPIHSITAPPSGHILSHAEGVLASVSVVTDTHRHRHLKVNDRFQMGGTSSAFSDYRQAHIPLLLHPAPEEGLFLGLGTGATFAASSEYVNLQATAVELVPEVVDALPHFSMVNGQLAQHQRLTIETADARRFIRTTRKTYDVVIADLFHPSRDGAGFLYTVEHFHSIRSILNKDGIFCQWLPVYQLDLDTFKLISRTFLEVFPEGSAFLAHYSIKSPIIGLVASKTGPVRVDVQRLAERINDAPLRDRLKSIK